MRNLASRQWRRQGSTGWWLLVALLIYLVFAFYTISIDWETLLSGNVRAAAFLSGFLQPDFSERGAAILKGVLDSLAMALTATVVGAVLAIPLALGAAHNIAPWPIFYLCRGFIGLSRAFPEIIIAIFFVAMLGFGTLAGFATLVFATLGFHGKLLAEAIEEIDPAPLEALKSAGANFWQMLHYAVQPQILPRFLGLSWYRLDINFRESAIIGIVGAGGIGATLNTALSRYEYETAAAILLVIIGLVFLAELASGWVRRRVQDAPV
jgi:phosphonate transport system permease protein